MPTRHLHVVVSFGLAAFLLSGPRGAWAQQSPAVTPAAALPNAEPVFRDLLTRYYEAYSRKDLPALEQLWHSQGQARYARNMLEVEFERRSTSLVGLVLKDVRADAGGGHARALVELTVTDDKSGQKRLSRRVRDYSFLPEGGSWKIWNESANNLGVRLATHLLEVSKEEAAALIESDPEIRSDDTLNGLTLHIPRLRGQFRLDEVIEALQRQAALARALDNKPVLAHALLEAGVTWQVRGQQDEARRAFEESRALAAIVGTRTEVAILDGNLGAVDYVQGEYGRSAERYRSALAVFEAERDEQRTASTLHSLGNALYMQGEFEQAMASYQRCLPLHEKVSNKVGAASVLQAIALVHKELGNYSSAIESYARSSAVAIDAGDVVSAAKAEHGVGDAYRLMGDFARSLQHLATSKGLWEKTPDTPSLASTIYLIGHVHALQRNFGAAIDWYQRALDLDEKAGEQAGVARDLGGLGGAHLATGKLDAALEEYRKSLKIREQLRDQPGVMWTVVHVGVIYHALARHSEALESYERALDIAEPQGDAGAVCTVLALRAGNELARDEAETALATAKKAGSMAERLELYDVLAESLLVAGKAHRRAGRLGEARSALEDSIAAMERVPVGPGVETFFDDRRAPYLALTDLLVSQNRPAEAFRWWERARGRALAAMLGGDTPAVVKGLSNEERDEERRLAKEVRSAGVKLRRERERAKSDPDRILALRRDLERLQAERVAHREALFTKHPALAALRSQVDPPELDSAVPAPAAGEAVVSYAVLDARTLVFLATRDAASSGVRVEAGTIDMTATDLAVRVRAFRDAVMTRRREAAALGRELYPLLLDPVRRHLAGHRSVVVIPDAFLWSLPFEALRGASAPYLVQDFAVSYAPSFTALCTMRSIPSRAPASTARPALVAAGDARVTALARERLALVRPASAPTSPPAARELRALSLLFGPAASRTLLAEQARADRVAAAVKPPSAVHLAVPTYLFDASPLYSLIAMPASGDTSPDQDLVEVGDAMSWNLPADFVLLPQVEQTVAGASGDSLLALAWSMFVAGAPVTVAGRWLPQAPGLPDVTRGFYRAWLARGTPGAPRPSPAAALQKAARAIITRPGSEPADWAGLMVIGR